MRSYLLFLILFLTGAVAGAQSLRSFTHEKQQFYDEVSAMLLEADKKETKAFLEEAFMPFWVANNPYTEAEQEQIYAIADLMLKKRIRPLPHFKQYLTILMAFPGTEQKQKSFATWIETMQYIGEKKSKSDLENYLTMVWGLFDSNTFYQSASTQWKSSEDKWTLTRVDQNPAVEFDDVNLVCYAKGDSSVIYATSGTYLFNSEKFHGKEGKITFERAGLDKNETYAIIQKPYELNIRSSFYSIDSVLFFNQFFEYPLMGRLEEKILANVSEATYPQFSSYDKRLEIKNIFDQVDYNGGFKMEGASLQGFGTPDFPAVLTFKRDNLPQLMAYSQFYTIEPNRISSRETRISLLINNDSIVHPSLQLRYQNDQHLLTLIRSNEGLAKSPYYDSYHKLDLYFEALYWKITDPLIEMGNLFGSTETRAAFESGNYFKQDRYRALQGINRLHPLIAIRQYARQINSNEFAADGLAVHMGYRLEALIPLFIDLSTKGFLSYDVNNQTVEVKQKLYDYISASAGNIDYDVLLFNSDVSGGTNAKLNLVNYDLMLSGVDRINMSDSQNVVIYPADGRVNVRKNRNFNCGGVIRSGKFEFYGKEYAFDYDKFKIDLIAVDSCILYVEDFDPDRNNLRRVKNVIEGVVGSLQIDNPFNKSGIQDEFTEYPILTSDHNSFVYYDNKRIQNGLYDRSKLYFELEPFTLDSLDNFDTEQVAFNGSFISGGIFPEMTEQLKIQKDYSLGFVRTTPPEGMPLYGGGATFKNDIVLNYNGLQGDGEIDYLTSVSASEQFTFFPDSVRGETNSFVNTAQNGPPEVPAAMATAVDLAYYPARNYLQTTVVREPINMYDSQAELISGSLMLSPTGLTGGGVMKFDEAELESDRFAYNRITFDSDTADFRLNAMQEAQLAFKTNNVKAHIDFENRIGDFKSNGEETFVEFPVNQFVCYMDQFKWFMDQNDIALETSREVAQDFVIDTDLDLNRSNFFSTHADQDSLNFMAPKAIYDLDEYTITADQIPFIRVADARITPDSGRVIIRRKAKIDPLEHAEILANNISRYHTIFDAHVEIYGRKKYEGRGSYRYPGADMETQIIDFTKIGVDSALQTVAHGTIGLQKNFFLNPQFAYHGEVTLYANQEHLSYEGSTKIVHSCEGLQQNWMHFSSVINPADVLIPVDTALFDDTGNPISVGLLMASEPAAVYGAFLSAPQDESDNVILTSRGYLAYNPSSNSYEIAGTQKLIDRGFPGNYVALDRSSCSMLAEGRLNLTQNLGLFDLQTIGTSTYNPSEEKLEIKAAMAINFMFNEAAMQKLKTYWSAVPDLKPVEFASSRYEYAMKELLGLEASDKVISELTLTGSIKKMPDPLQKTIFVSDVTLVWDPVMEAFVSKGDIGVASFGKDPVFRKLPGKIVIEKKTSGDVVHIYFEKDDENWYYFTYRRGLLQAYSSDKEFNTILMETKEDKRKMDAPKKEDNYLYMLGSKSKQSIFTDQFMF